MGITPLSSTPLKVLIVDDNSINAKLLKTLIKKATPCDVLLVESAAEALYYAITDEFDIIFLDIMMPILDGETVLQAIAQLVQKGLIPMRANIVVCTSLESMERLKRLSEYPMVSGLLRKPVSLENLIVEVDRLLSKRAVLQE